MFASPEIVSMAKGLVVNPKLKLISTAVEVCHSLLYLQTRKDSKVTKDYEKYKVQTEKDYK